MPEVLAEKGIDIAIIAVPAEQAQHAAVELVAAGVTGILNFAPVILHLPETVHVENIDMTVSLERVAFFTRPTARSKRK